MKTNRPILEDKKKKSDLIVLQEMASQNLDIRSFTHLLGGKKAKGGGILEIGVDSATFQTLAVQMFSSKTTHYVVTYIVNKEEFDKLKAVEND